MSEHVTPGTIFRLFRGHLSDDEKESLVRHLLNCPLCQGISPDRAQRQALPASVAGYELPVERALSKTLEIARRLGEHRQGIGSPSEFATPLALSQLEQVEELLERSRGWRFSDPRKMTELAELATSLADRIDPDTCGREVLLDVKAKSLAELANAYRVSDDLSRAARTMRRALTWLRHGTGDLLVRARVLDLLASLLADQRRLPQAIALTRHLTQLYESLGEGHLAGRAMISTGVFLGSDGRPEEGLGYTVQGLRRIDRSRDPGLFEGTFLTTVNLMTEAGLFAQARRTLWRCRMANLLPKTRIGQLHVRWIEGKIHAGLDETERAEQGFLEALRGLLQAGLAYNPALVGLDLALLWVKKGRRKEVLPLLEEMLGIFRHLEIGREALTVLLVVRHTLELPGESTDRVCRSIMLATTLLTHFKLKSNSAER